MLCFGCCPRENLRSPTLARSMWPSGTATACKVISEVYTNVGLSFRQLTALAVARGNSQRLQESKRVSGVIAQGVGRLLGNPKHSKAKYPRPNSSVVLKPCLKDWRATNKVKMWKGSKESMKWSPVFVCRHMEFVSILAAGKHCLWPPSEAVVVVTLCTVTGRKTGLCPV